MQLSKAKFFKFGTTKNVAIFVAFLTLSFFYTTYFSWAQNDIYGVILQVYKTLREECIFSPQAAKLESGFKFGLKEVLPGLDLDNLDIFGSNGSDNWHKIEMENRNNINFASEVAVNRMVESIGDPYTAVLNRADMEKDKMLSTSGKFSGIGVELAWKNGLVVVGTLPNSPAQQAGLRSGDIIKSVDGQSLQGLSFYRAGDLLTGSAGSRAVLDIIRDGNSKRVEVNRASLSLPKVSSQVLSNDLGYIKIGYFSPKTSEEVYAELGKLKDKGVRKLILDLRSNPGGDFKEGLRTAAIFHKGELVLVKNRHGVRRMKNTYEPAFNGPLAVLIDKGTASSAEIVSVSLKGGENVTLFGQKTFGKGLIQTLYSLPGGSGLRVSTGTYLSKIGQPIHNIGVSPDVEVNLKDDSLKIAEKFLGDSGL